MIDRAQLMAMSPAQRAELIYRHAQAELSQGLWRAALGADQEEKHENPFGISAQTPTKIDGLQALLAMMGEADAPAAPLQAASPAAVPATAEISQEPASGACVNAALCTDALGPNARFADAINRAAQRTGLPATALASIIEAEAARGHDGSWNVHSRNPRSSAAGLGQFLSGTWENEAERPGTWLNAEADRRGWLNASGRVTGEARGALLALRYSPEASIQAIADYAQGNLQQIKHAGIRVGDGVESIARAAYLGHHLGPGDAARFLSGGLTSARAQRLLSAQVGQAAAARRVAESGNAALAHREWLTAYIDRRINPARFG